MPAPDLMAAAVAYLRASPAVVTAFGEDTSSPTTTKFFADRAEGSPSLPWSVYVEQPEDPRPVSVDQDGVINYFCRGRVQFLVVAESKTQSRTLSDLLIQTLNDAPLEFEDGTLLEFRVESVVDQRITDLGPDSPVAFARAVTFLYMVQRTF